MNKQCDIFNGSTLNAYEKHELEKERTEKAIKKFLGNVEIKDNKKTSVREIVERDFIRTGEEVLQVKYKMRGFYVCTSIISNKECWVEDKAIRKSSNLFIEILSKGDRLLFRNDNDILIEGVIDMIYKNKKKAYKIVVQDVKDGEVICIEQKNIVRVTKVAQTERSFNAK